MADSTPVYDPESITLDEMGQVEEVTGEPFLVGLSKLNASFLKGLVFVYERRADPDFKLEDAGKVTVKAAMSSPNGAKPKGK